MIRRLKKFLMFFGYIPKDINHDCYYGHVFGPHEKFAITYQVRICQRCNKRQIVSCL